MPEKNLKHIAIRPEVYERLRRLGYAGDTFNEVVTKLLTEYEQKEEKEAQFIVK
jgi:predicted CopG family antitoxin